MRRPRSDSGRPTGAGAASAAVEQLGSGKAPVRLGGLYALERFAQDTPRLRIRL
jgi:hypothetical protein